MQNEVVNMEYIDIGNVHFKVYENKSSTDTVGSVRISNNYLSLELSREDFYRLGGCYNLAYENLRRIDEGLCEKENYILAETKLANVLFKLELQDEAIQINYGQISFACSINDLEKSRKKFVLLLEKMINIDAFHICDYDAMFISRSSALLLRLKDVSFRKVKIGHLLTTKFTDGDIQAVHLDEGRIMHALEGNYSEVEKNHQKNYIGDTNISRVKNMEASIRKHGYHPDIYGKYIICTDGGFIIEDGSHRASCICKYKGCEYEILVANWETDNRIMTDEERIKKIEAHNAENQRNKKRIEKRKLIVKQLLNKDFAGKRIIFKGGGKHTREVLDLLDKEKIEIVGVWDNNKSIVVEGLPSITLEDMQRGVDADLIFLSSFRYRNEMKREIESMGIDMELYDVYEEGIDKEFF